MVVCKTRSCRFCRTSTASAQQQQPPPPQASHLPFEPSSSSSSLSLSAQDYLVLMRKKTASGAGGSSSSSSSTLGGPSSISSALRNQLHARIATVLAHISSTTASLDGHNCLTLPINHPLSLITFCKHLFTYLWMVQSSSSATSSGGGGGGGTDTRDPANLVNPVPKADAADISAIDDTTDNHEVGFDGESTTTSSSATLINSIIMGDETFSASSQEDALAAAALSQDYFFIRWNIEHIWRKWEVRGANVSSNANSGDQVFVDNELLSNNKVLLPGHVQEILDKYKISTTNNDDSSSSSMVSAALMDLTAMLSSAIVIFMSGKSPEDAMMPEDISSDGDSIFNANEQMPDLLSATPGSAAAKHTAAKDFDLIPTKLLLLLLHGLDAVAKISESQQQQNFNNNNTSSTSSNLPNEAYIILNALESCFQILCGPRRSPSSFVAIVSAVGARFGDALNNLVILTLRLRLEIKDPVATRASLKIMESLLVTFDECRLQIPFVSASSSSSSLNNIHPSTATTTTTLAVGSGGMSVFLELLESKLPQLSDLLCAYIELQEDDISVVQAVVSEKEETNTTDHSQQQRRSLHFLTSYMDILSSCMAIVLSECRLMYRHRGDLPHPPYLADFITLVKLSLDRVIQLSSQTSSAAGRGVGGYGDGYVSDGSEGLDVDEQNHHHRSSSSSFSARVPIYRALYRRINRFAMDMSKIIWMSGDSEAAAATKNNTTSTTLSQQHQGLLSLLEDLKTNPSDITVVVNELVLIDAVEVTPCQCVESGLPDDKTPLRFCHTCRAEFFKQQQQQLMQQLDSGGGAVGGLLVAGTSDKDGPVTTLVPKRVIGQLFSEDGKRKRDILALREWADILTSRNPDIKLPSFVNGMTTTDLQNNNAGNSSSQLDVESIIPNGGGGNGSRRGSRTSKTSGISESGVGLNDSTAADISLNTPVGQSPRDLLSEYNGNDGTDILDSFDLDLLALETAQLISWTYADVKVTFPSPNAV